MILNYIKLSFRKFTRQKFYSLLNILGLATGMATVVLILLYVVDELSYDKFHRHADNLYRVVENQYYSGSAGFSGSSNAMATGRGARSRISGSTNGDPHALWVECFPTW